MTADLMLAFITHVSNAF